jgi:hypothetical protein
MDQLLGHSITYRIAMIKQILAHLERKAESKEFNPLPEGRAPPQITFVRAADEIRANSLNSQNCCLRKKRQVSGMPGDWNSTGLAGAKRQCWVCRWDSVRFRVPQGQEGIANFFLYLVD